ncbi:polysaccharide biosynthesis tyrosine autokinase [Elizabethkingia argentiflava]|uniref:non-specific protein-tyrosine kinase n=1 Tax=Elizabethkingia argenteiflava TaxID=2681556 RepID=A0A845PZ37_9FLAO|nr:tyrosine-protein kinase [Elizabethkingia argenteiflava]NAW51350.1 polysaccharide biosynthesis tyrosine autokinase [Elizabethkingia argenteiflava]
MTNQQNQIVNDPKKEQLINVLDLLKYLLHHWKWFAFSILVFGTFAYYQYSKSPFVYSSTEVVMIKTPSNTPTTARITRVSATNYISVTDEILQLKSKELMRQTVDRIGADISYKVLKGLREYELYKSSPVQVKVLGKKTEESYTFTVTPLNASYVTIKSAAKSDKTNVIKVPLNHVVKTPFGQVLVRPSKYYASYYGKEIKVFKSPQRVIVDYFKNNLKIRQLEEDASLLQITLQDSSPERASDIITMLIRVYNEVTLQDKSRIATNTANFIKDRLAIIESELSAVELNIENLKIANQGVDVVKSGDIYLSDGRQYKLQKTKIETDMQLAEMMRSYLKNKPNDLIPNNTGLVDASVEKQIAEYNMALLKKNKLAQGGNTYNPVVVDLEEMLKSMRNNINRAVNNALNGLKIKMKNAQHEESLARGQAIKIPEKQRVMVSIGRQHKVKEELYLFLLNKQEENALNEAIVDENIRVVDPAYASESPIYPSRFKKVFIGVLVGTVIPAIVLLSTLILNTGVRGRQDLENVLTVPFLGEIPLSLSRKQGKGEVLVSKTGRDPLTEAFRIVRTNINFMTKDGLPPKVITFTSFTPGVGKTFSVLNLATTLSFLDKKVVVLDMDLRKGTLSSKVNLLQRKGTSHYLSIPSVCIDDILHKSDIVDNIDFAPIGAIAPNPVELLLNKRLDQLIAELKERYDYIIIDSVPTGIVADASIVDRVTDLTLFLIRVGKMDRRQLPEIQKIYEEGKLSNLAILLNGVKLNTYGSYNYGYYGYGYGGYGYEEDKKNLFSKWFKRT